MSRLKNNSFLSKLVFLVGLLLLWSLMKGFLGLREAYKRVELAEEMLKVEEVRHKELKEKLEEVQKDEYVERVIRNELNMQKEGEIVVVLQDDDGLQVADDTLFGDEQDLQTGVEKKNWEKWLDLMR